MASRENFNLISRYGRQNFFRKGILGDRWARENVVGDTFRWALRMMCALKGHGNTKFMDWENGISGELCLRCLKPTGFYKKVDSPEELYYIL
mgnify:CR=1 FL=1